MKGGEKGDGAWRVGGDRGTAQVKGPNKHTIDQIKDAVRDGLRAVKNAIEDDALLPGAGALEVALSSFLKEHSKQVLGRAKLGVQAYAEALLVIPKTLASNAGHDTMDALITVQDEHVKGNVSNARRAAVLGHAAACSEPVWQDG